MASIALKDASAARGTPDFAACAGFLPGRTVAMYVNGQFAGVQPTGPFGTTPYGTIAQDVFMPGTDKTAAGAGKPVAAQDNTDKTTATTTVTLT